jgi:hypothetical protein
MIIHANTIEEIRPKPKFKVVYRTVKIKRKHDAQKVKTNKNETSMSQYFNMMDKLDYIVRRETKEEIKGNGTFYETND